MEPRRFEDNGIEVTIDVHGCSVPGALELIDRAIELAHAAGRQKFIVIHGMGGTDPKSSIRQALRESITRGVFADIVADSVELAAGGRTDMALRYHGPPWARRLTTKDLR